MTAATVSIQTSLFDAKQELDGYSPGHPWYYRCGGTPLPSQKIKPCKASAIDFRDIDKLKSSKRKIEALWELLRATEADLCAEVRIYNELIENGVDGLSEYDRTIGSVCGGVHSSWCTAISLVHNHISYYLNITNGCEERLNSMGVKV